MVKKAQTSLTLRQLLTAVSFWGTSVRSALFTFVAFATLIVSLSETTTASSFDEEVMLFIYIVGCFFVLDVGYVMVARRYLLSKKLDLLILGGSQLLLALIYVVPRLVVSSTIAIRVDPLMYAFFVPLLVIATRILIGILFGRAR